MMPPPSFMRVSTDGAARAALVVMALFTVGLSMSFWLFLLICAVAWLLAVRRIDWRQIDMVRLLSIAAGFIGMSAFLYWWRPRGWPDLSSLPQNVMFSLPLALYFALVQMHEHADRYDDRRLPRWADYVARVLATEAF
jgi:glucan phosphoethanolaminetransferase (alkaline phosphatase superfamily)